MPNIYLFYNIDSRSLCRSAGLQLINTTIRPLTLRPPGIHEVFTRGQGSTGILLYLLQFKIQKNICKSSGVRLSCPVQYTVFEHYTVKQQDDGPRQNLNALEGILFILLLDFQEKISTIHIIVVFRLRKHEELM